MEVRLPIALGHSRNVLRLILPSDGDLYEPARDFLHACNLTVERHSARRYTGLIPSLDGTTVLFQRTADITQKVEEGSAELGITGLDRFLEHRREEGDGIPLIDGLGFGQCELVIAVPIAWLDVTSINDLADLALEFRQEGKQLRIATKYPRLVQRYLLERGVNYFSLVLATGTLEAAPAAGYADLIADLTASGETLRENRLKPLEDGTVLESQACLIGNRALLGRSPESLGLVKSILEMMEGHLQARFYYRVSANIRSSSAEAVAASILKRPDLAGLQGPTVARVYSADSEGWYAVSLIVAHGNLLEVVEHLRQAGGVDISTSQVSYLFREHCSAYEQMLSLLGVNKDA